MNGSSLKYKTSFLLPKNNFLIGLGSVLNLGGDYFRYCYSKTDIEADTKAIYSDWLNVGRDIRRAGKKVNKVSKQDANSK